MVTDALFRRLASSLLLGSALLCEPMVASANTSVRHAASFLPKPDPTQTGRAGSSGWGPLRRFNNQPVKSETANLPNVKQSATSWTRGLALVGAKRKGDGSYRVYGFLRTRWKSETSSASGDERITMRGKTRMNGASVTTAFTTRDRGKHPLFSRGMEDGVRGIRNGVWSEPRGTASLARLHWDTPHGGGFLRTSDKIVVETGPFYRKEYSATPTKPRGEPRFTEGARESQ